MRLGLVTRRFDPMGGGTERDLMVTAEFLASAGYEIVIYAAEVRAKPPPSSRWRVRQIGGGLPLGRALGLLRFACSAGAIARRDGADAVLSFARIVDADILRSGGGAHVSYVQAARQWQSRRAALAMRLSPYHRVQMLIERRGYTTPALRKVIAVSNLVRDDLIRTFALDPLKAVTLYNGVDLERFKPAASAAERIAARAKLGLPGSDAIVVFVGNGFARKGLRFLLEAWPQIKPGALLVVAGADRSIARYRRLAKTLGIAGRVRFLGPRNDVADLFHAADALALPSLFEPFGNVVAEAMASGLPVLTSKQSGVAEIVPDEMRAFVVNNPSDPAEIATRLQALLEARSSLGECARAAAEHLTWERYGENLLSILNSADQSRADATTTRRA